MSPESPNKTWSAKYKALKLNNFSLLIPPLKDDVKVSYSMCKSIMARPTLIGIYNFFSTRLLSSTRLTFHLRVSSMYHLVNAAQAAPKFRRWSIIRKFTENYGDYVGINPWQNAIVSFRSIIPSALIKVSYPLILPAPPYLLMSF
jgi:hypothetical protein